jgi:hypothetical protein
MRQQRAHLGVHFDRGRQCGGDRGFAPVTLAGQRDIGALFGDLALTVLDASTSRIATRPSAHRTLQVHLSAA